METLSLELDKLIGVIGEMEQAAASLSQGSNGAGNDWIGQSRIGGVDF